MEEQKQRELLEQQKKDDEYIAEIKARFEQKQANQQPTIDPKKVLELMCQESEPEEPRKKGKK